MDELHRRILQSNRTFLVNNIEDVEQIVDHLYEKDVLTEGMRQDILQGEKTPVRRVRKLLDILPKRGPYAFSCFCNALIMFKQRHVAEHLDPNVIHQGATPLPPTANQNASQPSGNIPQPTHVNLPVRGEQGNHPQPTHPQPMTYDIHKNKQNELWSHGSQKSTNQKPGYGRQSSREVNAHQIEDNFQEFQFPEDWPLNLNMAPFNSRDFDVDSCTQEDVERVKRKDSYRMCSAHRGRAIIINNQEFSGAGANFAKRSSSESDSNRLQQVLQKLAFQVQIWRDVNYDAERSSSESDSNRLQQVLQKLAFQVQIWRDVNYDAKRSSSESDSNRLQKVLQKLAFQVQIWRDVNYDDLTRRLTAQTEFDHNDAFILVILSYGGDGTIFCEDGREMSIQEIINIFSSEKCKTLKDRPKLIFIQACGTRLRDVEKRMPPELLTDQAAGITKGLSKLSLGSKKGDETDTNPGHDTGAIPPVDTRDMLVAMATSPDTDEANYGSIFMLALSYVFCHCSKNQDLETMLHRMNQLQRDPQSLRYIQLCEFRSSLRKKLYFLPGYPLKGSDPEEDFPLEIDLPTPSFGSTKRS